MADPGFFRIKLTSLHYPERTESPTRDALPSRVLATLSDFTGAHVRIPINDSRTAQVTISMHDPAAAFVLPYSTLLHVTYVVPPDVDKLVFWGVITQPEWDSDAETVTINAIDRSLSLECQFVRFGDRVLAAWDDAETPNPFNQKQSEHGYVPIHAEGLKWLRDCGLNTAEQTARGVPDLGIKDGTDDTDAYTWTSPGSGTADPAAYDTLVKQRDDQVWAAMRDLITFDGAPDMELEPYDSEFGYYAKLNIYERQGNPDATRLIFHDGWGKDNCRVRYRPGGKLVTHNHVLTVNHADRVTVSSGTDELYGVYVQWDDTDTAKGRTDLVQKFGEQTIAKFGRPPDYFSLTPNLDLHLIYGRDLDVGDALTAIVRRGQLHKSMVGDIVAVDLDQADAANNVAQELEVAVPAEDTTGIGDTG